MVAFLHLATLKVQCVQAVFVGLVLNSLDKISSDLFLPVIDCTTCIEICFVVTVQ